MSARVGRFGIEELCDSRILTSPPAARHALKACLAIALFFAASSGAAGRSAAATFLRKQLPFQVDEVTTLESVASAGPLLIYNYRLTVQKETIDVPTFQAEMRRTLKQTACAQKGMRKIMSIGGSYRYVYLGADGQMIDEITIGPSDC